MSVPSLPKSTSILDKLLLLVDETRTLLLVTSVIPYLTLIFKLFLFANDYNCSKSTMFMYISFRTAFDIQFVFSAIYISSLQKSTATRTSTAMES